MNNKKLYVVIKDGNRTVGWDYYSDTTVKTVLQNKFFVWEPDTVKVNGKSVPDAGIDIKLAAFASEGGKVLITMEQPKKKKEETENG